MSNTLWSPKISRGATPIYQAIADALEHDLARGLLRDGARLPTHRELAVRLGVTPLTITRAYKEAARRGLIDSTVGRGTFVRQDPAAREGESRSEAAPLDLAKNIIEGAENLDVEPRAAGALRQVIRWSDYAPTEGTLRHRTAAAAWMARFGAEFPPEHVVITPGSQQAIVSIFAALCRPGDVVLAEEFTYPRFGAIAGLLHLDAQPVALDEHGVMPQSLEKACRKFAPKALYLIPNFQNPTGSVMPEKRRHEIAAIARRHKLPIIEDDVYGFLLDTPPRPIASMVPELTCWITSASKSLTPSLRLGFAGLPDSMVERVTSAFGSMTAFTSSVAAELFAQLLESGAAERTIVSKRRLVATNRRAADRALEGVPVRAHAMSPHLWIELPPSLDPWELADRARIRGVGVSPASAFAVGRPSVPAALRVSIGATTNARHLETALRTLASLIANPTLSTTTVV